MRKTTYHTIEENGRDKNKTFLLTEMSCDRAEKWALRALSAAAKSGVDVGDLPTGGMQGVAIMGLQSLLRVPFDEIEPLLDELFDCVKIVRDKRNPEMTFPLIDDDIEEVMTRVRLRMEVLKLHTDFLQGVVASTSTLETTAPTSEASQLTQTSPSSSGSRSRITRPR